MGWRMNTFSIVANSRWRHWEYLQPSMPLTMGGVWGRTVCISVSGLDIIRSWRSNKGDELWPAVIVRSCMCVSDLTKACSDCMWRCFCWARTCASLSLSLSACVQILLFPYSVQYMYQIFWVLVWSFAVDGTMQKLTRFFFGGEEFQVALLNHFRLALPIVIDTKLCWNLSRFQTGYVFPLSCIL